jgi:hypothetical protein
MTNITIRIVTVLAVVLCPLVTVVHASLGLWHPTWSLSVTRNCWDSQDPSSLSLSSFPPSTLQTKSSERNWRHVPTEKKGLPGCGEGKGRKAILKPSPLTSTRNDRIHQTWVTSSRGGASATGDLFPRHDPVGGVVRVAGMVTQALITAGKIVLPPTIRLVGCVFNFYRSLPQDAILAQVGLVYCFAGGYYPTLFSSMQAARHCGLEIVVAAIQDLTDEAIKVIDATVDLPIDQWSRRDLFLHQTNIVLKTVDPVKINQAAGALYTTWLGISAVLQKEYARVISLSLTMSYFLERAAHWILEPPAKLVVPKDYHNWVPVVIGWGCKAVAMNIAWRIQRILTASTAAMFGGVLFARAILRMIHRRGIRLFGLIDETGKETPLDEILGFTVAGLGFYTQMHAQIENNFSFEVPFPLRLVTWPFDWAEKWIQWTITREPR